MNNDINNNITSITKKNMTKCSAVRQHEIHAGHRVYGHSGKCQHLHGHSYIIHFYCEAETLDSLGMVVDFGIIKSTLCQWLEDNYDHRMLIWENDPIASQLVAIDSKVVLVPYNPTAENIANYLLTVVAPSLLNNHNNTTTCNTGTTTNTAYSNNHSKNITITKVIVEETSKFRAIASYC